MMIRLDNMLIAVAQIASLKDNRPHGQTVIRLANGDQIVTGHSLEEIERRIAATLPTGS